MAVSLKLHVVGGCRNEADQARLEDLMARTEMMGLQRSVHFYPNASLAKLHEVLGGADVGLHTMQDEHFGISVVDYMAAGCIPLAHDSGARAPHAPIIPQRSLEARAVHKLAAALLCPCVRCLICDSCVLEACGCQQTASCFAQVMLTVVVACSWAQHGHCEACRSLR